MSTLAAIEHALTVIDSQRGNLGVEIAQAALQALESQHTILQTAAVGPEKSPQRKQVTILFAHINGLTAFVDATPGHHVLNLTRQLWQRLDAAILQHGGYVDKHTGSTIMGVFGVPHANEDDAERAVRAALTLRTELQEYVVEISDQIKARSINNNGTNTQKLDQAAIDIKHLYIQVGLNSGLVLVDEVGRTAEYTVIGDSVNLASRLQQIAPPNGIIIAQNSYHLVPDIFELEPLGPVTAKGKVGITQCYLVNGLKNRLSEVLPRNLALDAVELVGRDAELSLLAEKWHEVVMSRQNHFLLLVGEAGMGKSRLVADFFAKEDRLGTVYQRFDGRAESRLRQTPFALLRNLFITVFNLQENESLVTARAKVLQGMAARLPQHFTIPPAWSHSVLQIIGLERDPFDDTVLDAASTQHARENVIRATVEFWSAAALHASAILLVLEDLHWADVYSLRWVLDLADQSRSAPLMIVGLSRPDFFESYPYWEITSKNLLGVHFHKMVLNPLMQKAARQLVLNILQKLWIVPEDLCQLILGRTDGNPYYVEELIKVLIEDGVIVPDGRHWQLKQAATANVRVPMTLTGVIQARLDNLPFPERITLQRAAVLGREFWQDAIYAVNRTAQRPLPKPQTAAALANLVRRGMLQLVTGHDLAGGQTFAFKHTLLHQVAYESVLLRERPLYHHQAAQWLTAYAGERLPDYAALIGGHLEQGQDAWGAAQSFELAARHANDLSDLDGSIAFNQKALLLAGDALHRLDWRLGVYRQLVESLFLRARLVDALKTAQEMAVTANKVGDMAAQVWVLEQSALMHREQSEFAEMLLAAQEAEQIARLLGSGLDEIDALLNQVEALWLQNEIAKALLIAEHTFVHRHALNAPQKFCKSLYFLGMLHFENGQIEQAQFCLSQLFTEVQRLSLAATEASILADCQVSLGRLGSTLQVSHQAVVALQAARQIYAQLDYRADLALVTACLGQIALSNCELETAVSHFQDAVETAEAVGHQYHSFIYRLGLAEAYLKLDAAPAAVAALESVRAFTRNQEKIANWRYQSKLNQIVNDLLPNAAQQPF
ncbi:MAG: AAA family ATPase [Anaerolineales bacterium]|nr:AAA family ATPase [Anaerolineales bacterium]